MKVGITERGDAGLDYSWINKLYDANIIITKQLYVNNSKLIDALLSNKEKIILHVTCTGYGGTVIEPHVPRPIEVHEGLIRLISLGFPVEQVVLRTDPIIPTKKGLQRVKEVWDLFKDTGVHRVRYSVIDMYPHVQKRFEKHELSLPFSTFIAPQMMIDDVRRLVIEYGYYNFEACAESLPTPTGCVSQKDIDILKLPEILSPGGMQRKGCLCCSGKTELLDNKNRCPSGCLYCYWRD